ncbi:response regulator transcription factor [Azoarcus sp. KH32C]|uniref:response regulator transcription factor n=1 Tax=Azoarcus sp. KH32C TaxID=748247 RepID=UPI0002386B78|nr:response regulator [Azoarcus sp. KH32C]BAL24878.1 two-component system, chemotaxis family, response regulator [Azoarcus sp. KH32C]
MKARLLIVDDSMVIRNLIARQMLDERLPPMDVVGLAADGEQALAIALSKHPDFITMDLTMPNMDGEACIERLAAVLPSARIMVVSALSDKTTALRAISKGAHGFLHKPFTDEQLVAALLELMS